MLLKQLFPAIQSVWWDIIAFGIQQSHPIPLSYIPGWCHPMTVKSEKVVGVKAGDSGVLFGYQVDEVTHT